jgi:predicted RNase H-like nuclease (RuvC/YqgF family)
MDNWYSVLITIITILGGTTVWGFLEKRARNRERDAEFIRNDCRDRIAKLEALLKESSREKDDLRELVLQLTSEVAELRVKVEYLTQENNHLSKQSKRKLLND